jgi:hypothetical protein
MRTTTLIIIAAVVSAIPFAAWAADGSKPIDREKVRVTLPVSGTQIRVTDGKYICNGTGSYSVRALFTNTSTTAQNTYGLTWETTAPGACTRQGTCSPSTGGNCIPPCLEHGPDLVRSYKSAAPLVIEKGASKQVFQAIPNAAYKKIVVKVEQVGALTVPTFDVVPTPVPACSH